jgi:N6-L-threonylcarbamoyladenine synthase
MIVLGIESSCDDTSIGIVNDDAQILAHVTYSQVKEHLATRGVVPEIGARAHVRVMDELIRVAIKDASLTLDTIDAIAATCGPGLIGGVMVGMMMGKGLASALNRPFIAINHLEAHVLTPRLTDTVPFPYLTLLISGGHTQILMAHGLGCYELLGESLDDACGEAFDKSGKMMGLPYPAGPFIEKYAAQCVDIAAACARYPLPRPLKGRAGCDFSFSGLKTAVRETIQKLNKECRPGEGRDLGTLRITRPNSSISPSLEVPANARTTLTPLLPDLCASLQTTIGDVLCDRVQHAAVHAQQNGVQHFVVAGGVAANKYLRARLSETVAAFGMTLVAPPLKLCTDNGVMVAWAGVEYLRAGVSSPMDTPARPRWPLALLKKV